MCPWIAKGGSQRDLKYVKLQLKRHLPLNLPSVQSSFFCSISLLSSEENPLILIWNSVDRARTVVDIFERGASSAICPFPYSSTPVLLCCYGVQRRCISERKKCLLIISLICHRRRCSNALIGKVYPHCNWLYNVSHKKTSDCAFIYMKGMELFLTSLCHRDIRE